MEAEAANNVEKDSAGGKNKRKRKSANMNKEPPQVRSHVISLQLHCQHNNIPFPLQAKGTIEILPYGALMPPPMQPPPPPAHQQQLKHWQHLQHPNQQHTQVILNTD